MRDRLEGDLLNACESNDDAKLKKYYKQIEIVESKTRDYSKDFPVVSAAVKEK